MSLEKSNLTRRQFLRTTGAASAMFAAGLAGSESAFGSAAKTAGLKARPNILVLTSDEHNPFISEAEGDTVVKTPNMKRLAQMGTYYESCYCMSPLCCPSRSAYMSGLYVHQIQTYNNCCIFKDDYPTYGEVLRKQGIHTVHIGKVDVYRNAYELGFSEMHIGTWPTVRDPGDLNIAHYPLRIRPLERPDGSLRPKCYGPVEITSKRDEVSINTAVNWIKTKGVQLKKPWALAVNTSKPHFPNEVTQDLWDMYEGCDNLPEYGKDCKTAQHPYAEDLREHFQTDKFKQEWVRGLRRGYYGCVTYLDRKLGQLLDALEQTNLIDNTIVIYTSDHGEMHGKFGMWWKSAPFESSARVPLIVAGPGFGKNVRVKTAVNQLDLQATLFRVLGCKRPSNWHGTPLQDIASNDPDRPAFAEYHGHGVRGSWYLIRKGPWKLIYYVGAPNQLFNIEKDPQELNNVLDKHLDIAADMEKEIRKICDPEKQNIRAEKYIYKELAAVSAAKNAGKLIFKPGGHAESTPDLDDFIEKNF